MHDQVRSLLVDARRRNVTLQVIPFAVGSYPGVEGSFQHLRFVDERLVHLVQVEGFAGSVLLDRASDVEFYEAIFDHLSDLALSPRESVGWLEARLQELVVARDPSS
jgi:hypothetical protein